MDRLLKNAIRKWLWPSSKPKDRRHLGVTVESMADWVRRPEWEYLTGLLDDELRGAMGRLLSTDPNNPAAIGRLQAAVRLYQSFTSGEVGEVMVEELKQTEKEAKNG